MKVAQLIVTLAVIGVSGVLVAAERPNVLLIITDDQGYGDIAAHGNEKISTPNLDALHANSVRLTNFHVDPTCSPTRSALMTGRYSTRTGVWHTIQGRSLMRSSEVTLAELFAANGYQTAHFGKWHLGDNALMRPQDQGFQEVLFHRGGGISQAPDWWGNDYFDDVFLHEDGTAEQFTGYCTDVWFREALKFIDDARQKEAPFFCYLATNAPHGPYHVADEYRRPYLAAGVPEPMASFYGMITNIDDNLGHLVRMLDEWKFAKDTVLIFMTDNGTAAGVARGKRNKADWQGFNAGMRGQKGSEYDGGHRVPFFVRYPARDIQGGRDVDALTAHIDVFPTLTELCSLKKPDGPAIDGVSFAPALTGQQVKALQGRTVLVHSQRVEHPIKWRKCAVMTDRWRLVNGKQLFDIKADPGQQSDVASAHPDVVDAMRQSYEGWWKSLMPVFDKMVRIELGTDAENPTRLCSHDWHPLDGNEERPMPVWNQQQLKEDPEVNGFWAVDVPEAGMYEFVLRMRPGGVIHYLPPGTARIQLGDVTASVPIEADALKAVIRAELPAGPARLQTWLESTEGASRGAYYVEVEHID